MYQALYRKYRPQTFDDVVGQTSTTETLKAQVISGKLSHAYLFTGTRGTGKTSCAKILAKAVNCLNVQEGNPCNACAACRALDAGNCLDVMEIDAASNNGVDYVRTLRDEAIYTPSQVRCRVYIIDEVHMLTMPAFNALLKILEEPPEHLIFILATTEIHKVPVTILSRCQRFSFRRLCAPDIADRLNAVAYKENLDISEEALNLLSRLADGAMRDGLSLLDQCAATDTVTADTIYSVLGLSGERNTAALLSAIAEHDAATVLELFSKLYAAGKDISALLSELCMLARDLLILKTAPKSGVSMLTGICTDEEISALQRQLSAQELFWIVSSVEKTVSGFPTSKNLRIDAELCLIALCLPESSLDAQALSARIGRLEEALSAGTPVPPPAAPTPAVAQRTEPETDARALPPKKPAQAVKKAVSGVTSDGFWAEFVAKIKPELPLKIRGFFTPMGGVITSRLRDGQLTLTVDNDFVFSIVNEPETVAFLEQKASAMLGETMRVRFAQADETAAEGEGFLNELLEFGGEHPGLVNIKE